MKKYLLLLSIMLMFLVSFRSSDNYLNSYKNSGIYGGSPLINVEDPLLVPSPESYFGTMAGISNYYCQEIGIGNIINRDVSVPKGVAITFFNRAYKQYLSREDTEPVHRKMIIFVDNFYKTILYKRLQSWYFKFLGEEKSEYGGWPFKLLTKVLGSPRRLFMDVPDPDHIVYNNELVLNYYIADRPTTRGSFEFIITEGKNNCKQPRGLIIHPASKRLVKVYKGKVVLAEQYEPNKINSYGDDYLWEARVRDDVIY